MPSPGHPETSCSSLPKAGVGRGTGAHDRAGAGAGTGPGTRAGALDGVGHMVPLVREASLKVDASLPP